MVAQMDAEGFGGCTWHGECQEACPKQISIDWIARLQGDFIKAIATRQEESSVEVGI
jgi:succinate dehydrogenase / fumarate reductase iron-sulfur subunit